MFGRKADGGGEGVLSGEGVGEGRIVVLERWDDGHLAGIGAEGEEAVGDGLGLDGDPLEGAEHAGHEGLDEEVAGEGFFGKAAVDDDGGDAAGVGDGEEVGPGFEFDEGDDIGADAVEERFDGEGEVEGEAGVAMRGLWLGWSGSLG